MQPNEAGRMVALLGDAELDEGNIYECLIEAYKHDIRNCWWIVDYNRQSLDATTAERMFRRFDEIFATCGWRVVRSEEHTSELQSLMRISYAVFCLKKKNAQPYPRTVYTNTHQRHRN